MLQPQPSWEKEGAGASASVADPEPSFPVLTSPLEISFSGSLPGQPAFSSFAWAKETSAAQSAVSNANFLSIISPYSVLYIPSFVACMCRSLLKYLFYEKACLEPISSRSPLFKAIYNERLLKTFFYYKIKLQKKLGVIMTRRQTPKRNKNSANNQRAGARRDGYFPEASSPFIERSKRAASIPSRSSSNRQRPEIPSPSSTKRQRPEKIASGRKANKTPNRRANANGRNAGNRPFRLDQNSENAWKAYESLRDQVHRAWERLQANVRRKAGPETLLKDRNELLLLLGECNYMARECMRCVRRATR